MNNTKQNLPSRGILIVFEGIDGTGKSTQLHLLAEHLRQKNYDVITTKEPTEGEYGKKIRNLYSNRDKVTREEELDLFLRDRRDHVENLLQPALNNNQIILCDRYYLSTIAYQGAAGMDIEDIARKNGFAPEPDLAFIFQLDPQTSIRRITDNRGDVLNDFEQEESLKKVENIFNSMNFSYIYRINADRGIEEVHRAVVRVVNEYLKRV